MRLFDTHCHIQEREFAADRADSMERALAAGVEFMLVLGVDATSSRRALALAREHAGVLSAAGVHPHDAAEATESDLDELEEMARDPRVVAVGEIGLDFYRNLSPRDRQIEVMRRQLLTATRVGKPVAVHTREAEDGMMPLLTEWSREMGGKLPDGRPLGVMHYFSSDAPTAQRYIDLGFVISVHTSVTHPKATQLAEVARVTPLEYLLIETDSPHGAPQRYRGKRNEPAYVGESAAKIAELKGMPAEDVADTTTRTAMRLFGLPDAAGERSAP